MFRTVALLLVLATVAYGQLISQGPCPTITSMANFNKTAFLGKWYTLKQYPTIYETIARCPTITYTMNGDGTYTIAESQISLIDQTPQAWFGTGKFPDSTIGQWNWNVPLIPIDFPSIPYQVLGTDYNTWANVYSCINVFDYHLTFLWIMTKQYPLFATTAVYDAAYANIAANNLDQSLIIPAVQLLCAPPTFDQFWSWIQTLG